MSYAVSDSPLFDNLDLAIRSGESVALQGPSGSGKTTLLNCIMGLTRPATGRVEVCGHNLSSLSARRLAAVRQQHVGMVFQFGELLSELSAIDNVAIAALLAGQRRNAAYEHAEGLLRELGVPSTATPAGMLSGGERQRTAVARALITNPALLLADEPTGALDYESRESVADLLFGLPGKHSCALLVVTHDDAVARRADRTFRLRQDRLLEAAA
ncbi:ABC transporter ATP-binding protein [Sphaerimonospora cavernae]|uniref:ABC transporter ATP-binding protein n=1 Tax=Sphaerimonospora cavernae TaxID=1740611 RepID=A0ABV6UBA8_9ACTN